MRWTRSLLLVVAAVGVACGPRPPPADDDAGVRTDAGPGPSTDAGGADAGLLDAGEADAGELDAGADGGGDGGGVGDGGTTTDGGASDGGLDGGAPDGGALDGGAPDGGGGTDAGPTTGAPPSILPVTYVRADVGTPVTPTELQTATDELIALLRDTRFFDFLDERVHGWPKNDPTNAYWWGTFWTGVTATRASGTVTYRHSNDGTDNAGIHTSPYLEGACYAHLLWGQPTTAELLRRMARGMSGWVLAMERFAGDTTPRLLARSFYPPPVTTTLDGGPLAIDTSPSRPGIDAEPSDYIHHPNNPTLGDIWVKNRRSKDDIGHMLRAMAQLRACAPRVDAAGQADLATLQTLYEAWAAEVDSRGFVIATRDASGAVYEPTLALARYTTTGNVECVGTLAVRMMHTATPGTIACQSGFSSLESLGWQYLKNDARQILRSHHAAAVVLAFQRNQHAVGLALLQGLGDRVSRDYDVATSASPPSDFNTMDVAGFFAYAASVGVPLRSSEVRWLHAKLHDAYVGMRAPQHQATFDLFDPSLPDGTYSFDPPNVGLFHRDLTLLLGTCASPYRNPTARPLLDCSRLAAAFP